MFKWGSYSPPSLKKKHSLKENRTSEDILLLIEHWYLEEIEQENVSCNYKLKKERYIFDNLNQLLSSMHAKEKRLFYCGGNNLSYVMRTKTAIACEIVFVPLLLFPK